MVEANREPIIYNVFKLYVNCIQSGWEGKEFLTYKKRDFYHLLENCLLVRLACFLLLAH